MHPCGALLLGSLDPSWWRFDWGQAGHQFQQSLQAEDDSLICPFLDTHAVAQAIAVYVRSGIVSRDLARPEHLIDESAYGQVRYVLVVDLSGLVGVH